MRHASKLYRLYFVAFLALSASSAKVHAEDQTSIWATRELDYYASEKTQLNQKEKQALDALYKARSAYDYATRLQDQEALPITQQAISTAQSALDHVHQAQARLEKRVAAIHRLAATQASTTAAVASRSKGSVDVRTASGWRSLDSTTVLKPGDTIRSGDDGFAELLFSDGTLASLGANSTFLLETDSTEESQYRLLLGRIKLAIKRLGQRRFTIRTPNVAIGVRGTEFLVETVGSGATAVAVLRGSVELTGEAVSKTSVVAQGQRAIVQPDGTLRGPEPFDFQQLRPWWDVAAE